MPHFTSRTAINDKRKCKRLGYNRYHALGTGLRPGNRVPVDLVLGQAEHTAAQYLLLGGDVNEVVHIAQAELETEGNWIRSNQMLFDHQEDAKYLVELLTRLFAKLALPEIFEQYEVLEVEQDDKHWLGGIGDSEADTIYIEIKPDAKLRNKINGDLGAFSLKTTGRYANWMTLRDQLELQNYTEPWAVGGTFVQMCYMAKGQKGPNFPFQGNMLLYPYTREVNGERQWSWTYNYTDFDGKARKMTDDWERVKVWEWMNIDYWLQYVDYYSTTDSPQPWHRVKPYDKMCVMPLPIGRRHEDIYEVLRGVQRDEQEHFAKLRELGDRENDFAVLEELFPREFTECSTMTGVCPYYQACLSKWTPIQMRTMGFVPRVPHHRGEAASFIAEEE